jgi:NADPH-dependent 2,4-dienoyl-CoA reductase/sulfur reductase-like enzyme
VSPRPPERLVVIGGDAGGMSAASQARRHRGPGELSITAFERGRHTSYSACGIPYLVGGVVAHGEDLVVRTPEKFAQRDIDVHVRHEATAVDLDRRQVHVRNLDDPGCERVEPFDQLMIATGATPIRPDVPGADAAGIFGVQVLDDGLALHRLFAGRDAPPKRAVVVGGGYIGLEMAEALVSRGLEVTLVEKASQPMGTLDPDMGALVAEAIRGIGVTLHLDEGVDGYETGRDGRVSAVVTSARTLPADLVVLGLGVRPDSRLAEEAGLGVGQDTGGIVVDRRMRTTAEGVWAAGDCVEVHHRVSRRPAAIALGTHANKQGRVAGINIGGGYATFPGVVGTAVSKICSLEIGRTGLREVDALGDGFEIETVMVESTTRAGYFPGSESITTKLIAERRSGRLLGAQIVGREGAAKRIDVLACALWNEMTVDEIAHLDLGYAPPFSPVWDPVLIAARKAWEQVEETAPRSR